MKHARDHHQIVYHYADGVADILGLSTAQQLAIRTAMHLALREQAAEYEATQAELSNKIDELTAGLVETWRSEPAPIDDTLTTLLATVAPSAPAPIISTNGTQDTSISIGAWQTGDQPDPTPAQAGKDRKPADFRWPTLDDVSLCIVGDLDEGRLAWRNVSPEDKRIIVLATVAELQYGLPPGEALAIHTFDRHRPIWMPSFPALSTNLGMTWKQMLATATQP